MPSKEHYLELIEKEFSTAAEARRIGNEGKARVCARRAAGHAVEWYLSEHPQTGWGISTMTRLAHVHDDRAFPEPIRDAAARLTAKISRNFTYAITSDPDADARLIVDHFKRMLTTNAS